MEVRPIRVVQYGLGATGRAIARQVSATPGLTLVGAIDINPELVGRDLGKVLELEPPLGMAVWNDAAEVLRATHPDIAVIATLPRLPEIQPQIETCVQARVNVISTCEELIYPFVRYRDRAYHLDHLAHRSGVAVLGVGVNPGFAQDMLPLVLTGPSSSVQRIRSTRIIDASLRRASLHQRIGAGLARDEFCALVESEGMPHKGLHESVYLIADCIGWEIDQVQERVEPIMATEWVHGGGVTIAPGQVTGARQTAVGWSKGQDVIVLDWETAIGVGETYDEIIIEGVPPVHVHIKGGLHGAHAVASLVAHAIPLAVAARPGLHTVDELPPIHYQLPGHMKRRGREPGRKN